MPNIGGQQHGVTVRYSSDNHMATSYRYPLPGHSGNMLSAIYVEVPFISMYLCFVNYTNWPCLNTRIFNTGGMKIKRVVPVAKRAVGIWNLNIYYNLLNILLVLSTYLPIRTIPITLYWWGKGWPVDGLPFPDTGCPVPDVSIYYMSNINELPDGILFHWFCKCTPPWMFLPLDIPSEYRPNSNDYMNIDITNIANYIHNDITDTTGSEHMLAPLTCSLP